MWCEGTCLCFSKGKCRLAAELAHVATNHTPVTESECGACKASAEPSIASPNRTVAAVAFRAVRSQRPTKAAEFNQRFGSVFQAPELQPGVPAYSAADFPCAHRSKDSSRTHQCTPCDGGIEHPVHACGLKGRECTVLAAPKALDSKDGSRVEFCIACDQRESPPVAAVHRQTPRVTAGHRTIRYITTAEGHDCGKVWANRFRGQSVFLVCAGPSLQQTNLELLNQRGIAVAAINNAAALVRPMFAFMSDPPWKFHQSVFADPGIATFVKSDMINAHTREIVGEKDGQPVFRESSPARDYPNVWSYQRDGSVEFTPSEFFTSDKPRWAVSEPGFNKRSTMLSALRMLVDFGLTTIFLVGCDFSMTPDNPYGFRDAADAKKCAENNQLYGILNRKFAELRPVLEAGGIRVVNCTPGGNLEAFERMPLEDAVTEALKPIRPVESLYGHYWIK